MELIKNIRLNLGILYEYNHAFFDTYNGQFHSYNDCKFNFITIPVFISYSPIKNLFLNLGVNSNITLHSKIDYSNSLNLPILGNPNINFLRYTKSYIPSLLYGISYKLPILKSCFMDCGLFGSKNFFNLVIQEDFEKNSHIFFNNFSTRISIGKTF